jgi:hypothetical protein
MRPAKNRHVVHAVKLDADVRKHDHLFVISSLLERTFEERDRIYPLSGKELFVGPRRALWYAGEDLPARVIGPGQQRSDSRLRLSSIWSQQTGPLNATELGRVVN